jgi:hypothetical protein
MRSAVKTPPHAAISARLQVYSTVSGYWAFGASERLEYRDTLQILMLAIHHGLPRLVQPVGQVKDSIVFCHHFHSGVVCGELRFGNPRQS